MLILAIIFSGSYKRSDWINSSQWKKARKKTLARERIENYWICKYSLEEINNATDLDIDHIIRLKYAFNQCFYLRHWYYMYNKYHLVMDTAESGYIVRGLKGCKDPILKKKFK